MRFFVFCFWFFFLLLGFSFSYAETTIPSIEITSVDFSAESGTYVGVSINHLEPALYNLSVLSTSNLSLLNQKEIFCSKNCSFTIPLEKTIFGNHTFVVSSSTHTIRKNFSIDYVDKSSYDVRIKSSYSLTQLENNNFSLPLKLLFTSPEEVSFTFEIYPSTQKNQLSTSTFSCSSSCSLEIPLQTPLLLDTYYMLVYSELGEKQFEFEISSKKFQNKEDISSIISQNKKTVVKKKSKNFKKTYDLEEFIENQSLKSSSKENSFQKRFRTTFEEIYPDGSSKYKTLSRYELSSYTPPKHVVAINIPGIEKELELDTTFKDVDFSNISYVKKISKGNTLYDPQSSSIPPGIYRAEFENGTSNYYAHGLLSINTKKPLYLRDEIVELVLVVLDSNGYPYSSANISLEIETPDNSTYLLGTSSRSIIESNKSGVYLAYFNATTYGRFTLDATTQVDDYIIERQESFNVVEEYPFDILRDVPATIDPWQGPFRNVFSVLPQTNITSQYMFEESIPNSFSVEKTDADEIVEKDDRILLRWFNLSGISSPFYVAQTPLITPYLFYLGKASVSLPTFTFSENRSWLFAIDPLLIDSTQKTCSDEWGEDCSLWPADVEGDNTFDACPTSIGNDEYVREVRINQSQGIPGQSIEVTCDYSPFNSNTEEYIYYFNGTGWKQLFFGNAPDRNPHSITRNVVLDNSPGTHWFRCTIDWDGEGDFCANQGQYYDNDDVSIEVINPFLTLNSPENRSYLQNVIETSISTNLNANISYRLDNRPFKNACSNCTNYSGFDSYTKGQHRIEVIAVDLQTGETNTWEEFFTVLTDQANPSLNSSGRTCSDSFGFNCSLWPSTNEGDNTFDACPTSIGNDADEHVDEVEVNVTSTYVLNSVNVSCYFDPFSAGTEEYISYYNGSNWKQLFSGNAPDGNPHVVSTSVQIDNVTGTHWFRCAVDWDGEGDFCANQGQYYDNDDVDIEVVRKIDVPFILSIYEPQNVTYTTSDVPLDFSSTYNTTLEYSLNGGPFVEACSNCNSFNGSVILRDDTYTIRLKGYDPRDNTSVIESVSFTVSTESSFQIDPSGRTCSDSFGFNCSLWPADIEGDNTFDACPTSIGTDNDEHVNEVEVNVTSTFTSSFVNVSCYFDPFNANSEEYISYYNGSGWKQLFSGIAPDGNPHIVSTSVQIDNVTGTHWFRCTIDWDGENDFCADQGQYYDNDDVDIEVLQKPSPVDFALSVIKPQNTTYNVTQIPLDFFTTKNANISYRLNGGSWNDVCFNCSSYQGNIELVENGYTLEVRGVDVETSEELIQEVNFTIDIIEIINESLRLELEKITTRIDENTFRSVVSLRNKDSVQTPQNATIYVFGFLGSDAKLLSNFSYSTSTRYSTSFRNETLNEINYNGTIVEWGIVPNNFENSSFGAYAGSFNQTNMWNVSFVYQGRGSYDSKSLFEVGFDPQIE